MIIVAVLAVVGVGAYYIVSKNYYPNSAPADTAQQSTMPISATSVTVNIQNFSFNPGTITVRLGTKVTWVNNDGTTHTITSLSGAGPSSGALNQGDTYSYTFNTAGTFNYHCRIHSSMQGSVIVSSQ